VWMTALPLIRHSSRTLHSASSPLWGEVFLHNSGCSPLLLPSCLSPPPCLCFPLTWDNGSLAPEQFLFSLYFSFFASRCLQLL
jgi:hypothetical protein